METQDELQPRAIPEHSQGDYVVILDAGSQFGKVIDRKVRELRVESKMMPLDTPTSILRDDPNIKGVIISGGPASVYGADAPTYHADLFTELKKPLLGICYGMQLMALVLGGTIERKTVREDGQETIECEPGCPLFEGLSLEQSVLLTHGDSVGELGPMLKVAAKSRTGITAALQHISEPMFGVQFHPEVDLTVNGVAVLHNFLRICRCSFSFTMEDREAIAIRAIRAATAQGQKVLCLASGGVDSTVCAALLLKALGAERVICIHIDHGFMREGESAAVVDALSRVGVMVTRVDAAEDFANAVTTVPAKGANAAYTTRKLCECVAPEDKRHIIGNTFMSVCDAVIKRMSLDVNHLLLAQGTLRPDLIESGSHLASKKADAIKTHHNDTEVVRQLRSQGKIIEPLSDYHKDEVRELGRSLGLPDDLIMRQPFPGPGLAIRTLCCEAAALGDGYRDTKVVLDRVVALAAKYAAASAANGSHSAAATGDEHDNRVLTKIADIAKDLELNFVVLPIRTVGVQGDGRTYSNAVAITTRAERGKGNAALPTHWTLSEWRQLLAVARMLPQVAHKVNRVVFAFGGPYTEHPTTVTPTTLSPKVLARIRRADAIVNQTLLKHNLVRKLSQVPVVLVPVGFEMSDEGHSVVIRTFLTNDFMTGVPATPGSAEMPLEALSEMVTSLQSELSGFLGRVLYDLTAKPPGTTEWE